jgi:hypothetical protein
VVHQPRDELGGGSAWAAGFIDASMEALEKHQKVDELKRLRRADLLAALCQETLGDHSIVPRRILSEVEAKYVGRPAPVVDEQLEELHIKVKPKKQKEAKKDKKANKEKKNKDSSSESEESEDGKKKTKKKAKKDKKKAERL